MQYAEFYYANARVKQLCDYGFVAIEELKRALQPVIDEIARVVEIVADALIPITEAICNLTSETE